MGTLMQPQKGGEWSREEGLQKALQTWNHSGLRGKGTGLRPLVKTKPSKGVAVGGRGL